MNTESLKNFLPPMGDFTKILGDIYKRTTEQNLEIMSENWARLSEQLKRLTTVRKPEDFINLQKECFNENVSATIDNMQRIVHVTMENMEEGSHLLQPIMT